MSSLLDEHRSTESEEQVVARLRQQAPEEGLAIVRTSQRVLLVRLDRRGHFGIRIAVWGEQPHLAKLLVLEGQPTDVTKLPKHMRLHTFN